MGWYFSVALPDDPAPCHDAAETLRSVARAARRAADFLDGQGALPREDFGGLAARSYRDASAALGADSRGVADDTHGLAVALDDYAARIAAVRRTLAGVRDDAMAQGFTITPEERVESVPVAGTTANLSFQRLEARATRAHAEAEAARSDWWQAVQDLTTGPLAPTSDPFPYPFPYPPAGPAEMPSDTHTRDREPADARRDPQPPVTAAPFAPIEPASSPYGPGPGQEPEPEPAAPVQPVRADAGPAGPTLHSATYAPYVLHSAALPLPWAHLSEPPPTPSPTTVEGVLT